jgi:hypothetical protein
MSRIRRQTTAAWGDLDVTGERARPMMAARSPAVNRRPKTGAGTRLAEAVWPGKVPPRPAARYDANSR